MRNRQSRENPGINTLHNSYSGSPNDNVSEPFLTLDTETPTTSSLPSVATSPSGFTIITSVSSIRPKASAPDNTPDYMAQDDTWQEVAILGQSSPVSWHNAFGRNTDTGTWEYVTPADYRPDPPEEDEPDPPDDDDDAASCYSGCGGPCPSNCGEEGKGDILCADENCSTAIPCLDQNCEIKDDCNDLGCFLPLGYVSHTPGQVSDLAAAGVLTSFSGFNHPPQAQNAAYNSYGGDSGAFNPQLNASFPQDFVGPDVLHRPQLQARQSFSSVASNTPSDGGLQPVMSTSPSEASFFGGLNWLPSGSDAAYDYANHIFQYHDPSHGNTPSTPCTMDHTNSNFTTCTLPVMPSYHQGFPFGNMMSGPQASPCGFQIQSPGGYNNHLLMHHRGLFENDPNLSDNSLNASLPHNSNDSPLLPLQAPQVNSRRSGVMNSPGNWLIKTERASTTVSPVSPVDTSATPPPRNLAGDESGPGEEGIGCLWIICEESGQRCGKTFSSAAELDKHCRIGHVKALQREANGGFRCRWENCRRDNDAFSQRGKLNRHLQVHTHLKPFVCDKCGLSLSAKQALEQHLRLHSGDMPYKCPWEDCDQTFKQSSALTMHYRTHTGEKPLQCPDCGAWFRESSNLTKHRRTHLEKGRYACEICGKHFRRLDSLRRHIANHKESPDIIENALSKAVPQRITPLGRPGIRYDPSVDGLEGDSQFKKRKGSGEDEKSPPPKSVKIEVKEDSETSEW